MSKADWIERDDMRLVLRLLTPANALASELALTTGLRIGDCLSLRASDLKQRMTVHESKTGKSKSIYIRKDLLERMQAQSGDSYVFESPVKPGQPRTRQAVYKDMRRAAKALRIPAHVSPHSTRKIYAVDYYRKHGLDATVKALNHDSASVTVLYLLSELL